jgi:two-component system, OmpR family, response regulator
LQLEHPPMKEDTAREVTVVHFTGCKVSLDEVSLRRIHDQLLALADEPSASELLLDFGNVKCVSGSALGILVSLHKKLLAGGRHMTVGNLSPQVHEVFVVTRLDKFLNLRLAGQGAERVAQNGQSGSPTGFLVVDDETAVLYVLAARLRIEGFKVWLAGHGHQAIELYHRHREEIALVLLEVLMPGIDGPHTLTALRELYPTVGCCFMTGNPTPYTEEALLQMGAVRIFRKPISFTEVIDTLNRLARQSQRRRQDRWIETSWKGV